jgi:hypothetical protein
MERPMERVVFIPFPMPHHQEFLSKTLNWVQERPNKNFRLLIYNPNYKRLGCGPHPRLQNLMNGSHIYIRGHGLPGKATITTSGQILHIMDAIDRIIEMGLSTDFRGTIKFYSCFSGLDQPRKYVKGGEYRLHNNPMKTTVRGGEWEEKTDALARVGASYFRSWGFELCRYVGYLGPLTGKYEDSDSSPDGRNHKWCEITVFNPLGMRFNKNATNKVTRAIDAQREF